MILKQDSINHINKKDSFLEIIFFIIFLVTFKM